MRSINWSEVSYEDYHQNIDYLLSEWSEKSAKKFIDEVERTLELLVKNPKMYPLSNYEGLRKAVITKQITLYYKIQKDSIILVRFWNNYQNSDFMNT